MEKKSLILAIVAVLAIAGATVRLVLTQTDRTPRANVKPFEQLGIAAAEETAKLLNQQGSVVLVVESMDGLKNPNAEAQIKGFKARLGKNSGVKLKEVSEFKRNMSDDPRTWPPEQAARFVSMGAGADALVLFVGFPQIFAPADGAAFKASTAKILAVSSQSPLLESLVAEGSIRVAIVGRTPPKPAPSTTETPLQWFERVYTVLRSK